MTEKKEYRSSIRSRRLIRQAFIDLLRQKKYERITVTDIVRAADINRSTFYAHYPDVQGLVDEIQDEIMDRSISLVSQQEYQDIFSDPLPFLQSMVQPLAENQELYKLLGRSDYAIHQMEKLKGILIERTLRSTEFPEHIRNSEVFRIRLHFFSGGIINTYLQWIQGALDTPIERINEEVAELIQQSKAALLADNTAK